MQELQSRNNTVITDAGKDRAVVIIDGEDYIKEAKRQLNNKKRLWKNKLQPYYC